MRFRYSTTDPTQSELDSLPRLLLILRYGKQTIKMNFFIEFDICFYRSQLEFEVKPKSR